MVQDIQTIKLDKDTLIETAFEAYKTRTGKPVNDNFTSINMSFDEDGYSLNVEFITNYNKN